MNLSDFLARVLPSSGLVAICYPRKRGFQHHFYEDLDEAASAASSFDAKGNDVYFGCASYLTDESRKADNVAAVRSFWLDIDAGEGKPYAKAVVAAKAVLGFAQHVGLPQPLLVSSGRGIHAYWTMYADMAPTEWLPVAQKLKIVARDVGLEADPARTSDIASVLRPPGTHNRKRDPLPVRVVLDGETTTLAEFEAALDSYIEAHVKTQDLLPDTNDDLSGGMEYPPADAERIANECGVIALVRDTRGDVDQPTWYHTLQVLAHTENGEQLAHEWSNGHPDYTPDETNFKLRQASQHKPTTCKKFSEHQPDICAACPHYGKINSPISLGMGLPQQTIELPPGNGRAAPQPQEMPKGYVWDGSYVYRVSDDGTSEDEPARRPIIDTLLMFTERYDLGEEGMAYRVEYVRQGELKHFTLHGSLINRGGAELSAELGKHEVGLMAKTSDVQRYLQAWMSLQKDKLEARYQHQHFGWQDNLTGDADAARTFLLGSELIRPDGSVQVLLRSTAVKRGRSLTTRGSYERWKYIIDRAYNHEGMEPFQFLVLCGLAAPVFAMFGNLGGVTVFAHSGKSGRGKSTACHAALSVWGDWSQMILANKQATANAFWKITGTYHNLPIVYDELTNMAPDEVSDMVYCMSHGRPKERLNVSGEERDNNDTWRTIMLSTGNNLLSEKLASHRADATPEMARLFEFHAQVKHAISPSEADILFRGLLENYGHAGRHFAEYLVKNYDDTLVSLTHWRQRLVEHFAMRNDERFWSALFASVMLTLGISRKLGILQFDPKAMLKWIGNELANNRQSQVVHMSSAKQHFSQMLSDLTPGIIETDTIGNLRKNRPAIVHRHARGTLVGRSIQDDRVIWLSTEAVRRWCVENRISAREMMREIVAEGWVQPDIAREALGRGTCEYASQSARTSVYIVDLSRVEADKDGASAPRRPAGIVGGSDINDGTRRRAAEDLV